LNDRRRLPALAPGEFADSLNVELSRRAAEKRFGFSRLGSAPLKNGSLRLDGVNDYVRIKNITQFSPAQKVYIGIAVVLRSKPVAGSPETVWSWGFGTGANLNADLRYLSDGGTGSLGAWVLRVRDSSGAVTVTVTLDDGNGDDSIIGQYRYLEAVWSSSETSLTKWSFTGLNTAATGAGIAGFNHGATQDLFIGVGTTALNTVGTDYIDATIAELRYSWGTVAISGLPATPTNLYYSRELDSARIASSIIGYWKFNDGLLLPSCEDSGPYGNDAVIVNNPASWLLQSDESRVVGESAITFNGGNGWCDIRDIDGTKVAFTFNATAPNVSRWTIRFVLILPALPAGYTTWPDGVILWAGTSTTLPSPVAIRVVSDQFVALYNDNGTLRTVTLATPLVTSLAGKRMRMAFYRTGTGTGSVVLGLAVDNGNGTITTYFSSTACTGAAPSVVSSDWALGRHVTNFDTARLNDATAFHTDGSFFGTIDDFQIIHTNQNLLPVGLGSGVGAGATNPLNIFQEVADWGGGPAANSTQLYLKFNDGAGNIVQSTGPSATDALGGWRVYLRPETDDGARWDVGLVEPYLPVRGTLLFPYNRFLADGSRVRSLLIGSGTTLTSYDEDNGLQVVGALPGRADACSAAQYGSKVIIAGPIGRRPVIFEGGGLRNAGIRAPTATPVVTVSNTGPGAFVAGQYYLYVTYRSTSGGTIIESNPSPGILVTFAAGNDTIDSIVLPVSSDPQVNQRRIYMTAVAVTATDGANAYLVATVDDNSTVTYTTDIVGPVSTSSTALNYFDHAEAPDATVVGQFLDYTLLGGSQKYPTRLHYSFVGTPDYWDPTTGGRYLDLDIDSGDPIIAIAPLLDRSIVDVGDGKWGIYATGDADRPLAKTRVNDTHGAVGSQASLVINNQQWYIGESDFYVSDGYRETNISSPDEPPATAPVYIQSLGRTSIQDTLKQRIDWTERNKFCVIEHRARNQIYFCVRLNNGPSWLTGSNTHVFVYDTIQGFWSPYDLPIDCGALAEIASEKAEPVAVVQGWVVKLDQDTGDGAASSSVLTVTAKTASATGALLEFASTPFSGLDYRHLRAFVYHKSDHTIQEHRITGVPATNQLLLESNDTTVAIGDLVIVAAAPYYFDLIAAFGDPAATKALLGVATNVEIVSASATMRLQHKGDVRTLPSTLAGFASRTLALSSSIVSRWQALGGFGTDFYVRVSETGYAAGTGVGVFPGGGSFRVHGMSFEGRETAQRSRS